MNTLPIRGNIPTEVICKQVLKLPTSEKTAKLRALLYGDVPNVIKVSIFPPHPYDFKIIDYKPLHREIIPMTVGELANKIQSAPQDSLLVRLDYDRFSKNFHVEPLEIISMIDYSEDNKELDFHSVYFENGKMIDCSMFNSVIAFDQSQKVSILKQKRYGFVKVSKDTPLYLYSKSEGKLIVTDIVTFRGAAMSSERNYIGIVTEEDIFIPDFEDDEE